MSDETEPIEDTGEGWVADIKNHLMSAEEKQALLEKVTEKLQGKMVEMTEEEIDAFYDTRGF